MFGKKKVSRHTKSLMKEDKRARRDARPVNPGTANNYGARIERRYAIQQEQRRSFRSPVAPMPQFDYGEAILYDTPTPRIKSSDTARTRAVKRIVSAKNHNRRRSK